MGAAARWERIEGERMMTAEFADQVVPVLLNAMTERLQRALASGRAAQTYLENGDRVGALRVALDVEGLTAEADRLLDAAAVISRLTRE